MTSAQTMLTTGRAPIAALALLLGLLTGCTGGGDRLVAPETLTAPYDTSRGEVLWAVLPLRNESGTSVADALQISDKVASAVAQVRGVRALPLNRTIAAMRALGMKEVRDPSDVRRLAEAMGADGVIAGSVTAYDPYNPPTIGLSLALYSRPGAMDARGASTALDVSQLRYQPTDYRAFPRSGYADAPVAVVSEHLDAKNHAVLMDVRRYAGGRSDPRSALGWERYLASMDLYTEFAAWRTVERVLEHEWIRLARPATGPREAHADTPLR
jgi:hypothetical protein